MAFFVHQPRWRFHYRISDPHSLLFWEITNRYFVTHRQQETGTLNMEITPGSGTWKYGQLIAVEMEFPHNKRYLNSVSKVELFDST